MIYMRCKCGDSECWTSMGTQPCQGCAECGTTYGGHEALIPHEWIEKYNQNTGRPYKVCHRCYFTDPASFKASKRAQGQS